jgi:hypothetical protein
MFQHFTDWAGTAVFYRVVTSKDSAARTVSTTQTINAGAAITFGRWTDKSVQTNQNDKFVLSEVGRFCLAYQSFFVSVTAGTPAVTTTTFVQPDNTWYAVIGGKKYFIEGVYNVGGQNELYVFSYRKDR